ncbi:pyrBI operon leader peptide [Klebsiella pneumoniae]
MICFLNSGLALAISRRPLFRGLFFCPGVRR